SGRYSLADVPAGAGYQVRVQAPGYAPALTALDPVPAGGTATGRVTLAPYAGTIAGRVVDEATGDAVAGARVLVERHDLGVVATAATSQGGDFAAGVPNLAGAAFRVVVTAPGYLPLQTDQVQLDALGKASLTGEKQLKLAPAAATLNGRVLDEDGQPVAALPVLLEQEGVGLVAEAQTAEDGTFGWPTVTAGARYRVRVAAPEMTHRSDLRQWALAGTDWVQPAGGRVTSVTLGLRDGKPQDYGRGQVRGLITRPGGAPLAGATVELIQPGFDKVVATTTTAADGSYRFDDVKANRPEAGGFRPQEPGNSYVIRVSATGCHPAMSGAIDVTPARESLADLALHPTHGTLAVRVTNQAGKALDLADVRLHLAAGGEPLVAKTVNGLARVTAPVGQRYWLEVVRPGSHSAVVAAVALSAEAETNLDLVLQAAFGSLGGRVADSYQKPVAGATVTARLADGTELTASTAADGSYRFGQVPAGAPLVLTAGLAGYTAAASGQVLTLQPGAETQADLTLRAATGTISGRVAGEGGPVAAGLEVQLWLSGQGLVDRTTTDGNGLFTFKAVPADPDRSYEVRVIAPGAGVHQAGFRTPVPLFRLEPGKTVYLQLVVTTL
ncbi:MAG TPA: carboxypeptidase-like regulatory domain-containing protein, partial [Symbiobacteriaceae bacterium]|nr:carboxypeptidase-like regulatory domain-containing protein [Symbiobacteriaceae bacterium]